MCTSRRLRFAVALSGLLLPGLYAVSANAARYGEQQLFRPDEVIVQYRSATAAVYAKAGYAAKGMRVERSLLDGRTHLLRLPSFTDVDGARRVLAGELTVGSLLVFLSYVIGPRPMDLLFTPFERLGEQDAPAAMLERGEPNTEQAAELAREVGSSEA